MAVYRCPECRTRRSTLGLLTRHLQQTDHAVCHCGGYHYAHRPGSPYCVHNAQSPALLAWRAGASDDEVLEISIELALTVPGKPMKVWR